MTGPAETNDYVLIGIGVLISLMYFVTGLGVARMMAKIKNKELSIFHIFFWFIVAGVFATCGDCE